MYLLYDFYKCGPYPMPTLTLTEKPIRITNPRLLRNNPRASSPRFFCNG